MEATDIYSDRISYKFPLSFLVSRKMVCGNYWQEFEKFVKSETVFKTKPRLTLDDFVKNFFSELGMQQQTDLNSSSDSGDEGTSNPSYLLSAEVGSNSKISYSVPTASQNRVADKVKALEAEIKRRLAHNFNSVRKAFLELDQRHCGYVTAEEIASFMNASAQKKFDYSLLEILIKMRTKNLSTRIYYNDFCAWLGNSVEPTETFYFRHDSKKNPQYELNMLRTREQQEPNQIAARGILLQDLEKVKQRFIDKTFQSYKSVKKAFVEWKRDQKYVELDRFKEIMNNWGLDENCAELFDLLDADKDGKLSFTDLKATLGSEIAP